MQATRVKFTMSDDTTLSDLLSLNLHNFEDEVHGIVDKACKEMGMEKLLSDLESNWKDMKFDYEDHPSGMTQAYIHTFVLECLLKSCQGYKLMRTSEELIETLEENQVVIQNMMTSKYIAFFLTEMSAWQKTLGMVDVVIARYENPKYSKGEIVGRWSEVQRTWAYLESIFMGSEDIRIQLPEDVQRFDNVDKEFKSMMVEMAQTPNVVKATNVETLPDALQDLQNNLIKCEKALAEYLDTKRLAFPRF